MTHELKILTYNIHKGFSMGAVRFVLPHIREAIASVGADLVFLQEVLGQHDEFASKVERWPLEPQFEFLAESVWPHFTYGKNAVYDEGHHGNAILSKHRIVHWENIDISNNALERRGILHGEIHLPHQKQNLHVICLHLDLFEKGRRAQIDRLCDRVRKTVPQDAPLIIAGDFNDWRERISQTLERELGVCEAHQSLHGVHARTFPSWAPVLRLDRIYVRGLTPQACTVMSGKPWNRLSDHFGLAATFAIRS